MPLWRDLFSPRQLLGHGYAVEVYRELLDEYREAEQLGDVAKAAFCYLALSLDKLRDYNSRMTRWHSKRQVIVNTFDRHDFAFKWSYAEMAPLITGLGFDWALNQTAKCIKELVEFLDAGRGDATVNPTGAARQHSLFGDAGMQDSLFRPEATSAASITVTCKPGDALDHVDDGSIDAVVMDPPYGANVMYAELSDFFYVWLKRTAGHVYPELFRRQLTDKENEAVASPARFKGQGRVAERAEREYQARMAAIFAECRRVLRPDGILTVMFTHKATGAWDALTSGLVKAGFIITASWPVNTEAGGSLHIRDKAAANSTIFLACRPRAGRAAEGGAYWEDVEPMVAEAVRRRVAEYEAAGIRGVDLYLSCFGPALEEFSKHWPLKRGQPRQERAGQRRRRAAAESDPYAVTVEDALDAARREVKRHRMDKLLRVHRRAELDPLTEWFVLAWDAFKAPKFPYDEGLRLARVVGLDLDSEVVGKVAAKDGSNLVLWDSATRAASGGLGPPDGSRALLDCLHHAAHRARTAGLQAARELLAKSDADKLAGFPAALAAVLEVLPVSSTFTHVEDEEGPVAASASDFEVLENLRRLAYSDRVQLPEQLGLWTENAT